MVSSAQERLIAAGVLSPLELGCADESLWLDCDLASFAENRLGDCRDPWSLDLETRVFWSRKALDQPMCLPSERDWVSSFWVEREGVKVGTLAITKTPLGGMVDIHSVYLRPAYRRIGLMADALRAVRVELEREELGLRIETFWTWQPAVRFYLRIGLWLRLWKRDLSFIWRPRTPSPAIELQNDEASISVDLGQGRVVLARAHRNGHRLTAHDVEPGLPKALEDLSWDARSTLALCIALQGWPLIRAGSDWERARFSDAVQPEALADRIRNWEAWSVKHGWLVNTPRIPGLDYRSWEELELE
jgi:hypothetical protein